jgi:hypothetical protein
MVAIHTIQIYGQIMNFDVKKQNILYYDIETGGHWQYKIHGKDYYVPNYGKLFILNDFGVSRTMTPEYPLYREKNEISFRLGSRYGIVKDGNFLPLIAKNQVAEKDQMIYNSQTDKVKWPGHHTSGAEFRMLRETGEVLPLKIELTEEQKDHLISLDITTDTSSIDFFLHPEVIPPFEFYNDTQDAIRTFIGGKRTTQKGKHGKLECITKSFTEKMNQYVGKGEAMKTRVFSEKANQVLAGYFIEDFFTKYTNYTKQPDTPMLGKYLIS